MKKDNFFTGEEHNIAPNEKKSIFNTPYKLVIVIILLLLLSVCIVYFLLYGIRGFSSPSMADSDNVIHNKSLYYDIPEIFVNLLQSSNKRNYLKISLSLKIKNEADMKIVEDKIPLIRDTIIMFSRNLYYSDFSGSGSNTRLKLELTKRVNKVTSPVIVDDVLIKDILIE